jgi:hypothetical protein
VVDPHPGARAIRSRQIEIATQRTITNITQSGVVISTSFGDALGLEPRVHRPEGVKLRAVAACGSNRPFRVMPAAAVGLRLTA